MALLSTIAKKQTTSSGGTTFAYDFLILDETHLRVIVSDADGSNAVVQTLNVDYTVTGVGNPAGGNIVFGSAVTTGKLVTRVRSMEFLQEYDYQEGDNFPADSHEQNLDILKMEVQQIKEQLSRSALLPESTPGGSYTLPDPNVVANQNKVIRVTSSGFDVVSVATTDFANPLTTKGDLVVHNGTSHVRLAVGADGTVLQADSTQAAGIKWGTAPMQLSIGTTKGDIIVYTASATPVRKAIGSEGRFLRVAGGQTDNLRYERAGLPECFNGLRIGTHPDASQADTKLLMTDCSYLVTDLGTVVTPRDELVCDNTVSGLGGIDTGSVSANDWWKIYYVFKGQGAASPDDPTNPAADGLIAHNAGEYDIVQYTGVANTMAFRDAAGRQKIAQTWPAAATGTLETVEFCMAQVGTLASGSNYLWAELYATSAGAPTGAALATSEKILIETPTAAGSMFHLIFRFRTPATVSNGTTYAIAINGDFTVSGTNYINLYGSTANAYAGGSYYAYDGATWTVNSSNDLFFRCHVFTNTSAVVLPSGYTEKCFLGWARTDNSNRWKHYSQVDRKVYTKERLAFTVATPSMDTWEIQDSTNPLQTLFVATGNIPHVVDARHCLPPTRVLATLQISTGATGSDAFYVGRGFTKQPGVAPLNVRAAGVELSFNSGGAVSYGYRYIEHETPVEHQRYMCANTNNYVFRQSLIAFEF